MAQQTIRFRIRPDGRVEELVEGIAGSGCEQLTEGIEARLGSVQQRQATSEAFQASQAAVTPEQTQTLPLIGLLMSHFSTVKTELRDRAALIDALRDLGHDPCEGERAVRGYRGQTVQADLALLGEEGGDIGFRWNEANGSYELVTDLDLWRQPIPVERFLAKLTQRYALRSILAASSAEGFQVSEQHQTADGSIELVVTRWE